MKLAPIAFTLAASTISCAGSSGDPPSAPPATTASSQTTGAQASGGPQDHTGGQDARATTPNPTLGAFGASCDGGAACESSVCFVGGKGGFCSLECATDADCPQPSSGAPHCNPHGYCRY
jgi:hypothetical protein